ncbi:C45 family autoproteolytic acyltransferase/hydolase [Sphaerisporangium aureirubrum]|uniref:C45 family autoproteolytic acyltransferase/hydrolase n=1 Tax=Sphaerisporangium aureirubrum TaxID=1544736 RepID=A0ABW1NT80_9ACTN
MASTARPGFPIVQVDGPPRRRGEQYGALARMRIRHAIDGYAATFAHYAGWDWDTVRRRADRFAPIIGDFSPASLAEIHGIADGAGVEPADVLALNTRSEIMFAARDGSPRPLPAGECTSFAVLPEAAATGGLVMGQNWDWLGHARRTAVLLRVRRDDGPGFVTLVEAGLLAKVGMNEDGVGLCTNTLIGDGDEGRLGVPYHLLLRSVLDSSSGAEAAARVAGADRAGSANYLIGDTTGFVRDLETTPTRGAARVGEIAPTGGVLAHANHFLSPGLTGQDVYLRGKPHSLVRQRNITGGLAALGRPDVPGLQATLADHRDAPDSVCQHPRESTHPIERTETIAGVVMEVDRGVMHLAAGPPCTAPWHTLKP